MSTEPVATQHFEDASPRPDGSLPAGVQAYAVGGAVRDQLLGRAVHDRDWVVVGATVEQMLAAGYRAVGRDFFGNLVAFEHMLQRLDLESEFIGDAQQHQRAQNAFFKITDGEIESMKAAIAPALVMPAVA